MLPIILVTIGAGLVAYLFIEGYANHHEYRAWLRKQELTRKARAQVRHGRQRYPLDIEALRRSHDKSQG